MFLIKVQLLSLQDPFEDCFREAQELADKLGCIIGFQYKGFICSATPGGYISNAVHKYDTWVANGRYSGNISS